MSFVMMIGSAKQVFIPADEDALMRAIISLASQYGRYGLLRAMQITASVFC